ncbi:MAG: histidine phosphatase family protein [Roseiarcus sp.]
MRRRFRSWIAAALASTALALACGAARGEGQIEKIVFVRHGEKLALGLGQLDCRGLNRALALPKVIAETYGKPDVIFAPDPAEEKRDSGRAYDYVRPLATIEPTAVRFGMPIDAHIGFSNVEALQAALEAPANRQAFVVVAWEHRMIDVVVRALLAAHGGDPSAVPAWAGDDFDSVDIVTIDWSGPTERAAFERGKEGLDGQSDACPP